MVNTDINVLAANFEAKLTIFHLPLKTVLSPQEHDYQSFTVLENSKLSLGCPGGIFVLDLFLSCPGVSAFFFVI